MRPKSAQELSTLPSNGTCGYPLENTGRHCHYRDGLGSRHSLFKIDPGRVGPKLAADSEAAVVSSVRHRARPAISRCILASLTRHRIPRNSAASRSSATPANSLFKALVPPRRSSFIAAYKDFEPCQTTSQVTSRFRLHPITLPLLRALVANGYSMATFVPLSRLSETSEWRAQDRAAEK